MIKKNNVNFINKKIKMDETDIKNKAQDAEDTFINLIKMPRQEKDKILLDVMEILINDGADLNKTFTIYENGVYLYMRTIFTEWLKEFSNNLCPSETDKVRMINITLKMIKNGANVNNVIITESFNKYNYLVCMLLLENGLDPGDVLRMNIHNINWNISAERSGLFLLNYWSLGMLLSYIKNPEEYFYTTDGELLVKSISKRVPNDYVTLLKYGFNPLTHDFFSTSYLPEGISEKSKLINSSFIDCYNISDNKNRYFNSVHMGYLAIVKDCLKRDPYLLNSEDEYKNTALDISIMGEHEKLALYLIEKGIMINHRNQNGFSAYDYLDSIRYDPQLFIKLKSIMKLKTLENLHKDVTSLYSKLPRDISNIIEIDIRDNFLIFDF